ncbi:MAG: hypothetical protein AAFQ82_08575 [Myxococcota bacterium]
MKKAIKGVFAIIEREGLEKAIFQRVGTCFTNRDDSLNVLLDAFPTTGKLHIRDIEPREERESA